MSERRKEQRRKGPVLALPPMAGQMYPIAERPSDRRGRRKGPTDRRYGALLPEAMNIIAELSIRLARTADERMPSGVKPLLPDDPLSVRIMALYGKVGR